MELCHWLFTGQREGVEIGGGFDNHKTNLGALGYYHTEVALFSSNYLEFI